MAAKNALEWINGILPKEQKVNSAADLSCQDFSHLGKLFFPKCQGLKFDSDAEAASQKASYLALVRELIIAHPPFKVARVTADQLFAKEAKASDAALDAFWKLSKKRNPIPPGYNWKLQTNKLVEAELFPGGNVISVGQKRGRENHSGAGSTSSSLIFRALFAPEAAKEVTEELRNELLQLEEGVVAYECAMVAAEGAFLDAVRTHSTDEELATALCDALGATDEERYSRHWLAGDPL